MRTAQLLRWVLVVPAAFAGWVLALGVGLGLHAIAQRLCPPALVVSGMCTASWFRPVEQAISIGSAALAAVLIVSFAVLSAPSHKRRIAALAYLCGAVAAILMGVSAGAIVEAGAALVAGLATLSIALRRRSALVSAR